MAQSIVGCECEARFDETLRNHQGRMRLGVVLTSHDTVAGASLSSRVGEQLDAFSSIGLKLISKEEQIVENQYGQVRNACDERCWLASEP